MEVGANPPSPPPTGLVMVPIPGAGRAEWIHSRPRSSILKPVTVGRIVIFGPASPSNVGWYDWNHVRGGRIEQ